MTEEEKAISRRKDEVRFENIETQIGVLASNQVEMRAGIDNVLGTIEHNTAVTTQILQVVEPAIKFFDFLGKCGTVIAWCGRKLALLATPVGKIAAAGSALYILLYQLFHNGNLPK